MPGHFQNGLTPTFGVLKRHSMTEMTFLPSPNIQYTQKKKSLPLQDGVGGHSCALCCQAWSCLYAQVSKIYISILNKYAFVAPK